MPKTATIVVAKTKKPAPPVKSKRKPSPEQSRTAESAAVLEAFSKSSTYKQLLNDIKVGRQIWREWQEIVESDDEEFVKAKISELQSAYVTWHGRFVALVDVPRKQKEV